MVTLQIYNKHGILRQARQYNGGITPTGKEGFSMIVNADEYFSDTSDLYPLFLRLADSTAEYLRRQDFMEEIKNGTEAASDLSTT